jgi:putative hydrolase of the HAD superfamily
MVGDPPLSAMARVQAVTFDLAGTLLYPHPSVGAVYAACAKRHGVEVQAAVLDASFALAFKGGPKNAKPEVFWKEVVQRCFGPALPASKIDLVFRECWQAFERPESWRLAPGSLQAISAIRFLGVKVGVLSNADARMRKVLDGHGLTRHLDGIFLSEETGNSKPDAKAFGQAARALGSSVSGLVHFGDSPTEDGEGARDAGATGVVVGGAHAPDRCLRNEKISEAPYAIRALLTEGKLKGKFSRTVQNLLANLRGLPEDRGRSTDRAMKTIDDAVQDAFKKLRLDKPVPETAIVAHWLELLPLKLAKRSAPLRVLEGGKLVVQCENSVIKSEVRFHERAMLAKIRLLRGCQEVRSISFVNA